MTNEEAIDELKLLRESAVPWQVPHLLEAIDMAIEALSQPIITKCYEIDNDHIYCSPEVAHKIFNALKDRPQGEWIAEEEYGDLWVCDQCGFASEYKDNFCHNCGARMVKGGGAE